MNRKHVPAVIGLLVLLVPACLCLPSGLSTEDALATASVLAPTLVVAVQTMYAEQTQTEDAGHFTSNTPEGSASPASQANATLSLTLAPPTLVLHLAATPIPIATPTEAPTEVPTEVPTKVLPTPALPLGLVTDLCKLLDVNLAGNLLGEKMVNTQKISQKGQLDRCYTGNTNFSTGASLAVAQDDAAVNFQLIQYAELDAVKGCATPIAVGADQVQKAKTELQQKGLTGNALIRESLTWEGMLIRDKGCTDQYGLQDITGLGDYAFTDHIYGYQEMVAVTRNTIIYVSVYKKGLTGPEAITDEQQLCQAALNFLGVK